MDYVIALAMLGILAERFFAEYLHARERRDWMKFSKVKDVAELEYVFPTQKEEPKEEDTRYVPLEDIPEDLERAA